MKNRTWVDAKWSIVYAKPKVKKFYGAATVTKAEQENLDKFDDPDVFNFHQTEVSLNSNTLTNFKLGTRERWIDKGQHRPKRQRVERRRIYGYGPDDECVRTRRVVKEKG